MIDNIAMTMIFCKMSEKWSQMFKLCCEKLLGDCANENTRELLLGEQKLLFVGFTHRPLTWKAWVSTLPYNFTLYNLSSKEVH